jgi:outer membrane lipoprotein-sorting protein
MIRQLMMAACVALFVALVVPAAPSAQTADDVIEKCLAAMGGRESLQKLTSRRVTGTASVSSAVGDLSGQFELDSKPPNKSRMHLVLDASALGAGNVEIEQRFDGTTAMTSNSLQGVTPITGSQLDNMRNNLFPTPFLHYKDKDASGRIELQPAESVNGRRAIVLLATPKVGPPVRMFFDAETYLLLRSIVHMNIAGLGTDVDQVSDVSDYRAVDGVKLPFRIENTNSAQHVVITLTNVEHNVALDDSLFAIR